MSDKDDCISRRAALDTIMGQPPEPHYPSWYAAQIEELPAVQPDHNADIGKKVSIPCAHENDLIFRQAAIDALARMMPRSYTPDGSHPADEEIFRAQEVFADCIEALEILQPAAPSTAHTTETTAETTAPSTDDWIPVSERMPENRVCVIVCFREWQQYAKRYIYSIVTGWYARKHSVRENVFNEWEADCDYDEDEDEFYIHEGWYEFTTQGNGDLMNWYINAEVIAWMPLPEPYRGG